MKLSLRLSLCAVALGSLAAVACRVAAPAHARADERAFRVLKKIALSGTDGWDYLTIDASARRLYISRSTHMSVIDIDRGQVVGDIPSLAGVHGVAIDARRGHGFTSNGRSNSVTIFDLKTLGKLAETSVGEGPDSILFDAPSQRAFTFNGQGQSATAIDAQSGKVVGTVALPGRPEGAVSDGRGEIFNNIEDKNEIVAFNARTLKIDHVWPLAPGEEPSGLAMDVKHRRLFAVCSNQKLMVMNADTGAIVSSLPIGNGPDACAYDPKRKLIFSPNGQDGTLSIIGQASPDQYQVLGTVATQASARTMALDLKTHHVFTVAGQVLAPPPGEATPGEATPGAPRRRRGYVEGSVAVLEIGAAR